MTHIYINNIINYFRNIIKNIFFTFYWNYIFYSFTCFACSNSCIYDAYSLQFIFYFNFTNYQWLWFWKLLFDFFLNCDSFVLLRLISQLCVSWMYTNTFFLFAEFWQNYILTGNDTSTLFIGGLFLIKH